MAQADLIAALASGKIGKDVYVWRDGLGEWKPAGTLAELKPGAAPAPAAAARPAAAPAPAAARPAAAQPAKAAVAQAAPVAAAEPEKKGRPRDAVSWTIWSEGGINLEEADALQRAAGGANAAPGAMPPMPTQPAPGKWTRVIVLVLVVACIGLGIALAIGLSGKKAQELPPAKAGEAPAQAPAAP